MDVQAPVGSIHVVVMQHKTVTHSATAARRGWKRVKEGVRTCEIGWRHKSTCPRLI